MSESERMKFCGATFDQPSTLIGEDQQTQTQQDCSAMFTAWNLIADLIESNDQKENEQQQQQQITDFYAKAGTTFPRLACLMQLYFNVAKIMEELKDMILFAEGDYNDLSINENFLVSAENIIKRDYYKYDKSYLPRDETELASIDPMVIVGKDAVTAAWKWYEHYLNIATKLFTIDPNFASKPVKIPPLNPARRKSLKQLIMLFDFNIFLLSAVTDKHPITGQTGFLKNRPALGERALQELLTDGLIKYNYFLTDIRGRNVRSYMKMPIPSPDDPLKEQFLKNLIKHDIDIVEYRLMYEKSSIPPCNKLSALSLQLLEHNPYFVTQYSKYRDQLTSLLRKHLENGNIQENSEGNFLITNISAFYRRYDEIENLVLGERQEQLNTRSQPFGLVQPDTIEPTATSAIGLQRAVCDSGEVVCNLARTTCEVEFHNFDQASVVRKDVDVTSKTPVVEEYESTRDLDHSSVTPYEKEINVDELLDNDIVDEECSITSEEQSFSKEVAKTNDKGTEQAVKKAMQNIMVSKSVIYAKTDLTQICNKPVIRLEAVKRLIGANLLQYGKNFWIEPNRTKKETKKDSKRLLKEGWLKKGPDSQSHASKFQFTKILQENVNLTYNDYLHTFHPYQEENVSSRNNWTLSDEVVEMFKSNFFYAQHVRWDIKRYRPCDMVTERVGREDEVQIQTILTQVPNVCHSAAKTTDDNPQQISQQSNNDRDEESETMHTWSTSLRPKRKAAINDNIDENQTRTQPRRLKKK